MKHYEKRRSVSGRLFVLMLALVLVLGCAVGGTVAWLVAKTFTYGDINITLTETKPANRQAKIIPGVDIEKDPKVTVKADSEACWLFVEVKEEGTFVANKVTYSVDDGWTKGDGTKIPENVYYRAVDAVTTDTDFAVLKDNKICVSEELTKSDIQSITTQPTLSFTAYAVQKDGMDTVAAAWAAANS